MKYDPRRLALPAALAAALAGAGCATSAPSTITVGEADDRIRIDYRSTGPAEGQVAQERISARLREAGGDFEMNSDGGGAFSITLEPGQRVDMYPLVATVGPDAWFIHGPTLLPNCLGEAAIAGRTSSGRPLTVDCRPEGYAVLEGAAPQVGRTRVIGPEGSPLAATLRVAASEVQSELEGRLGRLRVAAAPIGVTVTAGAPSGLVAHVDRNGTMLFEVRPGFEGLINSEVARTQVRPLLRHEMFHRWNMAHAISDGTAPGWLYEGAAEYAAGRLSLEAGDFSEAEYNWLVGAALTRCMASAGEGGLASASRSRTTDYDCGMIAGWALDLDLRGQGADFFAFWKTLLEEARSRDGRYGDRDWRALLAARGWKTPTLDRLLAGGAPEAIAAAFASAGADIGYRPAPADYRRAILAPALAANCTSRSYGFFDEPDRALLDGDTVCPGLPSQAAIVSAAGHTLFPDPTDAFVAARAQCVSGTLSLGLMSGETVSVRCTALPDPPASFRVGSVGVPTGRP
ncbi:hypothetical protein [Brevundimonas sp.]|uniref:hypothetical protein n=1 Tax=Brevundimonas sp. TaxID=1871086 RepID=UPI002737CF82|nr:hypothetical protein [Brevundimonas sp.]MDP3803487.1 hypothetical protein [Brevundimonas sp.]